MHKVLKSKQPHHQEQVFITIDQKIARLFGFG